jgi:hypothetical protein
MLEILPDKATWEATCKPQPPLAMGIVDCIHAWGLRGVPITLSQARR